MRKANKHIVPAALALSALLAASCSRQEAPGGGAGLAMRVCVSPSTRSAGGTVEGSDDFSGFCLQVSCADAACSYFERMASDGQGSYAADRAMYWANDTIQVTYAAAYFGGRRFTAKEFADSVNLDVLADQQTEANGLSGLHRSDLLMMAPTTLRCSESVGGILPITFVHGLAKLRLMFSLPSSFYDANIGNSATSPFESVVLSGARTTFKFAPGRCRLIESATPVDITARAISFTPSTASNKVATAEYEVVLPAQTFAPGALKLVAKVGSNYNWENASEIVLVAGKTVTQPIALDTP